MSLLKCLFVGSLLFGLSQINAGVVIAAEPRVLIEGAKLKLVASAPDIVTPVGMTLDEQGRLLVIESHTHMAPDDYTGPKGDRIRMFSDSDGDGELDRWSTFAEGFHHSMNLLAAGQGRVYVITRRSIVLLIDEDNDGQSDRQESIIQMETPEKYPHNGMSGIAHDGKGGLYFGLGENMGVEYRMVGSDGSSFSDRGGVGAIFHCESDGKNLKRFCKGFWNPFSICVLPSGQVFTVDNDPDSSPPCRLIYAVETGDYGHRFEYTRAGIHPLQAWNGELPGTLPMIAGVGESPCAVVSHRGHLWVTSWGDHRLERYRLKNSSMISFEAKQTIAVQGDSDFRPTGCVVGLDGSLYFADWINHSYQVHGQGRIWKLSFEESATQKLPSIPGDLQVAKAPLQSRGLFDKVLQSNDLFLRHAAVRTWFEAKAKWGEELLPDDANSYLVMLQAWRWYAPDPSQVEPLLRQAFQHESADVRLYAMRWVADERLLGLRDEVAALLAGEIPDEKYYLAVLSALEWLDGEPKMRSRTLNDGLLARELRNKRRGPRLHAMALRLISPDNKMLTPEFLDKCLQSEHQPLRLEAIRTLALQSNPNPARTKLLTQVAKDTTQSELLRAEAVAALAGTGPLEKTLQQLLAQLATDPNRTIAQAAQRVQSLAGLIPQVNEAKPEPTDLVAWNKLLAESGDAAAGRRLFFSARGARCAICHQHGGRGGKVGPDLTRIGLSNSREQLIASILQPSRDMAPHYQPWTLLTEDGKTRVGLRLHKAGDGGKEIYADADGQTFQLRSEEIEVRQASDVSIMPSGLEKTVSIEQLRDLVEFLQAKP